MFDRFTDHNKRIMSLARRAAIRLQHDYIDSDHMLIGLLEVEPCVANRVLRRMGVDPATLLSEFESSRARGTVTRELGQLPFTEAAKRALERCMSEAHDLGHDYIGSEHLLLGLVAAEGPAGEWLRASGCDVDKTRAATLDYLAGAPPAGGGPVRLLLISNSTMHGGGYLSHCKGEIGDFLGDGKRVAFVPYALADHDGYEAKAIEAFGAMGHELESVHRHADPCDALTDADAVFVGGGNTFRLLAALYDTGLLHAIRHRVYGGMQYIGSSAGTNVATLSIKTTNDMPIVMPPSFTALAFVPFQINPHYLDPDPGSTHMGETREERLLQFLEDNDTPVLALREGCMLRVDGESMELRGSTGARLFRRGRDAEEFMPPCDLSFLLKTS